jgi:hypothetical protein
VSGPKHRKAPPAACDPSKRPLPASVIGQAVRVHWNWHNGCYAVSTNTRGVGYRVQGYTPAVRLVSVTAQVSEAGFGRCHDDQEKNVHAWLEGTLVEAGPDIEGPPFGWRRVRYDCLKATSQPCFFYEDTNLCFGSAREFVGLPGGRMWASPSSAVAPLDVLRTLTTRALATHGLVDGRLRSRALLERIARAGRLS